MKQRKEFQKPDSNTGQAAAKKVPNRSIQELTDLIQNSIGKDPRKAAKVIETWVKDVAKPNKKAS
jgi:hypothetical protein